MRRSPLAVLAGMLLLAPCVHARPLDAQAPIEAIAAQQKLLPGVAVAGFDEVWVDYRREPGADACGVDVDLVLRVRSLFDPRAGPWRIEATTEPASRNSDTASGNPAAWQPKDFAYLASRWLGLRPDDTWRYAAAEGHLVLQRRWNRDLAGVEAIDLPFDGPAPARVNVVVADGAFSTRRLAFTGIAPDARLPDGRPGVRLVLPASLADRGEPPRLQELIEFFASPGTAAPRNPVRGVEFIERAPSSRDGSPPAAIRALERHVERLNDGRERVVAALAPLLQSLDGWLEQAEIVVRGAGPSAACGVQVEEARLVNTYRKRH